MADIGPWDTDENIISNVTALQTDMAAAEADIDDLEAISADRDEPTGFVYADPDTIPVTLSFVNGTRTLTVAPSASTFSFYVEGVKYTKNASETIVIANTEGAHFIYYDENGDLASTTTWSIDIIMKYAYVAAMYWDATNAKQIYLGYECHGVKMDGHTHSYLHESRGSQLESGGGGVGGISSDDAVPDADSTKFSVTQAEFWDEDVHITLNAKGTGDNIALYYKSGADASDIWRVDESAVNVCLATGGVGENRAAYNQNNGGTWQLTECTDNYYVLAHVFAFNDQTRKFGIIIGQNEYSSKLNAREGAITELQTLDLRGVLTQEIKMLATIIVHTKETYSGNAIYSRVVTTDGGEDFIDWRNSPLPQGGTSSTVTDHGALGGLDDTDHPASAIFTDVTNFNGNLSASDTTVQAALDTLDDAIPASIISGSASATITADGLDITDGSTSVHINISSGDLVILNSNDGGDVYIKGEVATDTEKTIFKGAPDGAAELYYSGTKKIETTSGGVKIGDGSSAGYEIEYDTGVMYVTNTQHAGIVYHQVEDTNGDVRNMIGLNPNGTDTQVYLYAGTGVWVFKTVDNGTIGGFELGRSSTLAKLNVNSGTGDFKIQNVSDGGDIYITGEVATDTEKTMAKFAPDGAAELYYAGTAILATTAAGISITDGTATAATIGFSEDDLIIDNNDVAGLIILKGEKTGPSEVTLASFNPDGAAELYYAGTKIFETLSNGIKIPFSASASLEITPSGNGVDFYSEYQGAPIKFRARNGADSADVTLISMDSNDTITMYHQGTAVFQLLSNGLAVNGGGGIATGFNFTVSNPDVTILNKWDGGDVYIKGEVATDTEKTMAKFAPDGAVELYYAGTIALDTNADGISVYDDTGRQGSFGNTQGSDLFVIRNDVTSGNLAIQVKDSGQNYDNILAGDADGATKLYYAGVLTMDTFSGGIYVRDSAGINANSIYNDGADFWFKNRIDGGDVYITGEVATNTEKTIFKGAPDGAAELYYAGTAILATTAAGISITDGTATAATIGFSADDLIIANNDPDGVLKLQAEKTGTGQSVLFSGDPDGAAYLYHAGVNVFQTTSVGGILVFNSNGESGLFCNDGSDLILKNNKDGGDIYIKGDTTVPATKICAKFAPDGAAELYYAGTKVFETTAAGISITDGTATAATIDFSSDDLYIKNNDADGHIYVSANDGYIFFQNAVGANEARVVIGASDSQQGVLQIMGDTTGSTIGGYIILNTAADHDSYINYFGIQVISDDMNIGPGDANCLKFVGDGAVANGGQWQLYYTMYMADEVKMQWDDNPATDLTGVGDTIVVTVDQNTVGVGGILRQENAGGDGNFDDGDKDAATTAGRLVMAVESGTGNKEVLERGYMRNDAWSWTPGEQLFLGDSGAITDATGVAAFGSGDIIQVIGYAHTATVVYFNPSPTYDEVA